MSMYWKHSSASCYTSCCFETCIHVYLLKLRAKYNQLLLSVIIWRSSQYITCWPSSYTKTFRYWCPFIHNVQSVISPCYYNNVRSIAQWDIFYYYVAYPGIYFIIQCPCVMMFFKHKVLTNYCCEFSLQIVGNIFPYVNYVHVFNMSWK